MDAKKFEAATARLIAERGITYRELATRIGVSAQHLSDCRVGRKRVHRTIVMALRAVAADAPPLPEGG